MSDPHTPTLLRLVTSALGTRRADRLFGTLEVPEALLAPRGDQVPRAVLAFALNMLLFEDLLRRVPEGAAYIADHLRRGGKACFDHGALRTVAAPSGALPAGHAAFARILEPLGYRVADLYPLPRIHMTGRAFAHLDLPEGIPQFFVSELHPEAFSPAFQDAVHRVLADSRDPLSPEAAAQLGHLAERGSLALEAARGLLLDLMPCFDRAHGIPTLADYELLKAESAEMAWIATEGNAFNHATDRVSDVQATAATLKALGIPMKEVVEESRNGRVFQTATRATTVLRPFLDGEGRVALRPVPGSFYEFITRHPRPEGGLDLTFDAGNATAIFKMTAAEAR